MTPWRIARSGEVTDRASGEVLGHMKKGPSGWWYAHLAWHDAGGVGFRARFTRSAAARALYEHWRNRAR